MRKIIPSFLVVFVCSLFFVSNTFAYWVWDSTQRRFVQPDKTADKTADELFTNALKMREDQNPDEAIKTLSALVKQYPKSAYAPEAQFTLGSLLETKGRWLKASEAYQKLIRNYPQSERVNETMDRLFKIGNLLLTEKRQKVMGVMVIPVQSKAIQIFQFITENSPYGPQGEAAQFQLGIANKQTGKLNDAITAFQTFIDNYPKSERVADAQYQLAEVSYLLSQGASRDQKAVENARDSLNQFMTAYDQNNLSAKAAELKQDLDNKDAEKNYRIGLYYQKEGFIESATIYYDDVVKNYSHTPFSEKAKAALESLKQPEVTLKRDKKEIAKRLAEIDLLLQAVSQNSNDRNQLLNEKTELLKEKAKFDQDKYSDFEARRKALKEREKALNKKFGEFNSRKKRFRKAESSELQDALAQWYESLKKEQAELSQERQRVYEYGLELQKPVKSKWSRWIPSFRFRRLPSVQKMVAYDAAPWDKLVWEKLLVEKSLQAKTHKLTGIQSQIQKQSLNQYEAHLQNNSLFLSSLPHSWLKQKKLILNRSRELKTIRAEIDQLKTDFEDKYGETDWDLILPASKLSEEVQTLIYSGQNLRTTLTQLQKQKIAVSEAWMDQKKMVTSVSKAFGEATEAIVNSNQKPPSQEQPALSEADLQKEKRLIKKKLKFVEREIRKRMDEIEDWERQNHQNIGALDKLLKSTDDLGHVQKITHSVTFPILGAYKLGKAFIFGLPDRNREVTDKAREETGENNAVSARTEQIRKLQETIQVQSLMIQGRIKEINALKNNRQDLFKESKKIPGFKFQSLYLERSEDLLTRAQSTAISVLPEGKSQAMLFDRLETEAQKLKSLNQKLKVLNQQIAAVSEAIKAEEQTQPAPKAVTVDTTEMEMSTEDVQAKDSLELQIKKRHRDYLRLESLYLRSLKTFEQEKQFWFKHLLHKNESVLKQMNPEFNADQASLLRQKAVLTAHVKVLYAREKTIIWSQINYLDQKLQTLNERLAKVNNRSFVHEEALDHEMDAVKNLRDELVQELQHIDGILKQPLYLVV